MESSLRLQSEQQNYSYNEISSKLAVLEEQLRVEERLRMDLREKLRQQEDANREIQNFVKSVQSQGDSELSQMRAYLQDKLSEDHLSSVKQKEKSTVLFQEVVRLGEQYEKQLEQLQNLNMNYENRIQTLEARLSSAEQTAVATDKKGEASSAFANEIFDRMEGKMQQVEQSLHLLKAER